jgi:hypothetical protein
MTTNDNTTNGNAEARDVKERELTEHELELASAGFTLSLGDVWGAAKSAFNWIRDPHL